MNSQRHRRRWEPAPVAAAFDTRPIVAAGWEIPALTFRGWLDLDRARSFLLSGEDIGTDADALLDQVAAALDAFRARPVAGHDPGASTETLLLTVTPPAGIATLVAALVAQCQAAFATGIEMEPPPVPKGVTRMERRGDDGLGNWLPLVSILMVEYTMPLDRVLDLPVAQGLALLAGVRCSQGWSFPGGGYRRAELLAARAGAAAQNPQQHPPDVDGNNRQGDQDHARTTREDQKLDHGSNIA